MPPEPNEDEILNDFSTSPVIETYDYELALEALTTNLDALKGVTDPVLIIESPALSQMLIKVVIVSCSNLMDSKQSSDEFRKQNRYIPVVNTYIWLLKNHDSIDFTRTKPAPDFFFFYNRLTVNERKMQLLSKLGHCVNNLLVTMIDLRVYSIQQGILEGLVKVIDNDEFLSKLEAFSTGITGIFVFNVNWLSKIAESYKVMWHELDAIRVLIKASNNYPKLSLYLYMATANIAYDKEVENLVEIQLAIDRFVELTNQAITEDRSNLIQQEFVDDDNHAVYEFEVLSVTDTTNNATISVTGLLLSLYRLSVNDKIKYELYQKPGLKESLNRLIFIGNDIEKEYSISLLAQLCFDARVNQQLRGDSALIDKLREIVASQVTYKKLVKTSRQLIWILSEKKLDTPTPGGPVASEETKPSAGEHIMISYNTASRDLCLRVKENLEQMNLKVWIDVEEIHGSSLDSMARAVENAHCVLMCVTEKYRQSLNCQAEAQYAFKLNKKIVPLIMQKGYSNIDGWLGIIIGDKIFIDFTKYDFDYCIKKLISQINLLKKEARQPAQVARIGPMLRAVPPEPEELPAGFAPRPVSPVSAKPKREAIDWDEERVNKWLSSLGLERLGEDLKPLNGKLLQQLYMLQIYSPEFFYKSLTKNDLVDLKMAVLFSSSLKDLFE